MDRVAPHSPVREICLHSASAPDRMLYMNISLTIREKLTYDSPIVFKPDESDKPTCYVVVIDYRS